ncbi:isochorismatase family cysteine hydrolase [Actinomadura sp. NBRC 104425]|uniref:cysteine hydrolase family protein n=1 Tax=Actinomadura sp. NBRC 104425 TaxID=3032204 RepID=UPI0025547243|nr:isochorismatase family cysteine hydrolase [Actinomadura sp. NBRC 104425]
MIKETAAGPVPGDEHTRPHFTRAALLTIDMQADFVSGPHAVPGTERIAPAVARLARAFRDAGRPIVHLVRLYLPDGGNADLCRRSLIASGTRLVVPHSPGSRLADGLTPADAAPLDPERLLSGAAQRLADGEHVIYKPRWSAFYRTPLQRHLADLGVDTLVVAGCNYPNCPRATIYDASARDYRLVPAEDATSRFGEHARGEMTGIAAWCLTVPTIERLLRAECGAAA